MGEVSKSWFSVIWRSCNLCMSVFFGLASYVQINDPDAGLWMFGYAVPALLCALVSIRPHLTETLAWRRVADLHVMLSTAVVGMLGWALYRERVTRIFQQEEGREFSGLVLAVFWLLLCRGSGRAPVGGLRVCTAVFISVFPFTAWLYYHVHEELRASWPSHCNSAL
ncbi:transmembrane protein 220 [Gouania willdenowi]|uniref:Transmembrane protein 220 n=1 Tax=Gouania willdenowi TaxID=441366 RepID=A0A8C5HPR2_GOUWI|nr:transmembrane protein 220 [Gouania willdenowi]